MDKAGAGRMTVLHKGVGETYKLNVQDVKDATYKLLMFQKGNDAIIDLRCMDLFYHAGFLSCRGDLLRTEERGTITYWVVSPELLIPDSLIWRAIENINKE